MKKVAFRDFVHPPLPRLKNIHPWVNIWNLGSTWSIHVLAGYQIYITLVLRGGFTYLLDSRYITLVLRGVFKYLLDSRYKEPWFYVEYSRTCRKADIYNPGSTWSIHVPAGKQYIYNPGSTWSIQVPAG